MDYLQQVQAGIDYIEAQLDFDIELADVAHAAGISQWHFQRIFKAISNETLKTYIRSRRLANSLDKLLLGENRIIDIALCAGFESQESFTRAFKSAYSLTPNEYRKIGNKSLFLKKIEFDSNYLQHINQHVSLQPEIYQQAALNLVGLKTSFYSVDSEKNNIAEKLPPLWAEFMARLPEITNVIAGTCYGVVQQNRQQPEQLDYYAAIAVQVIDNLPNGMHEISLPATRYAKFSHKGDPAGLNNTVNYIYSSWLLSSGERHNYAADLEFYAADYRPDSSDSLLHYAIPLE